MLKGVRNAMAPRPSRATKPDAALAAEMKSRARPVPPPNKLAKAATAKLKGKITKEVIRLPKLVKEAALATIPRTMVEAPKSLPTIAHDFGEAAFRRIAARRAELEHFTAGHGAPGVVSDAARAVITRRIALGADRA